METSASPSSVHRSRMRHCVCRVEVRDEDDELVSLDQPTRIYGTDFFRVSRQRVFAED